MKLNFRISLLFIVLLATTFCFYRIGVRDVSEWDEAHNGINALEMLKNGDYINLYYGGEPDTWNAKPPLLTWMIALSYQLFGFNEFALRFPVAICCILFFIYFFKLVEIFAGTTKALLTCLLLFACKTIFAWHMALNGDYDVPLLLFLTASIYHYIQFIDLGKNSGIFLAAIFTGLAFYTKGPASFLCMPGLLIYTVCRGRSGFLFSNYRTWLSLLIFLAIAGSWILLLTYYGKTFSHSFYGSKNTIETMFIYDAFERMTSDKFEPWQKPGTDYFYLFHALDSRMNVWNYVFYLVAVVAIFIACTKRNKAKEFLTTGEGQLVLLGVCILAPYALLLTFAKTKFDWYMAPAYGFIAFMIVQGTFYISTCWRPFQWAMVALFAFTFTRHIYYLHTLPSGMHKVMHKDNPVFKQHDFVVATATPQRFIICSNWLNLDFNRTSNREEILAHRGKPLVVEKAKLDELGLAGIQHLHQFDQFYLLIIP